MGDIFFLPLSSFYQLNSAWTVRKIMLKPTFQVFEVAKQWNAILWVLYSSKIHGEWLICQPLCHTLLMLSFSLSLLKLRGLLFLQINVMPLPSSKQVKAMDRAEVESTHTHTLFSTFNLASTAVLCDLHKQENKIIATIFPKGMKSVRHLDIAIN